MRQLDKQGFAGFIILIPLIIILVTVLAVYLYVQISNEGNSPITTESEVKIEDIPVSDKINEDHDVNEMEKIINTYDECIEAGYVEYSSISGPGFCSAPDGTDYYQ